AIVRGRQGGMPAFLEPMAAADFDLGFGGPSASNAREIAFLGDVDGDGMDDIGVLRGNPGQVPVLEVVFGRAMGGSDRRAEIHAALGVVLPRQPKLGRIRSGLAADAFVLGQHELGGAVQAVVFGGPGFPATLNLDAGGDRVLRLSASHWRSPNDAVVAPLDDIDGDGVADIVWRSAAGDTFLWRIDGPAVIDSTFVGNPGAAWQVAAAADLDGDGKADLMWRHADGSAYYWKMNGATPVAFQPIGNPGAGWQVVAP
ncbi:MAG: VCBS repeat-containing protein, partial [Burkholderiales bacterium]|nr:VCBS repeat-containing protein [Burkholderiales bacterium]